MFRIGEFSKIAQVSGRLLRFYDELGLLSPAFTDPQSGYRYYSAEQLPRLNRILVLKELGLSLEQITGLLERGASPDALRGMLTLRKAQIEQTVHEELARLRRVESRLEQIDDQGRVQEPDVLLKSAPAQTFLALREVLPGIAAVRQLVRAIATTVPARVDPCAAGPIAIVLHGLTYEPDALDVEVGCLITDRAPERVRLSEKRVLTRCTLPAAAMLATLVHSGRVEDSHRSYAALAAWIERNRLTVAGPGREILVQLPDRAAMAVLELQLPVRRHDEDADAGARELGA
jgi:DNA-binding transcriptional MerR regulator/effector-binding domain-containing protein